MLFKRIMVLVCVAAPVAVYAQSERHASAPLSVEVRRDTTPKDTTKPDTTTPKPDTTKPDTGKKVPPANPGA